MKGVSVAEFELDGLMQVDGNYCLNHAITI